MKCIDCKKWNEMPNKDGYGRCGSEKWNVNPNYYEDSDKVTDYDMVEVTYSPIVGKYFGCVHHEFK